MSRYGGERDSGLMEFVCIIGLILYLIVAVAGCDPWFHFGD